MPLRHFFERWSPLKTIHFELPYENQYYFETHHLNQYIFEVPKTFNSMFLGPQINSLYFYGPDVFVFFISGVLTKFEDSTGVGVSVVGLRVVCSIL